MFCSRGRPLIPHRYNLHYLNNATQKDRDRGAGGGNSFCSLKHDEAVETLHLVISLSASTSECLWWRWPGCSSEAAWNQLARLQWRGSALMLCLKSSVLRSVTHSLHQASQASQAAAQASVMLRRMQIKCFWRLFAKRQRHRRQRATREEEEQARKVSCLSAWRTD